MLDWLRKRLAAASASASAPAVPEAADAPAAPPRPAPPERPAWLQALRQGDWSRAEREARAAMGADASAADPRIALARALIGRGQAGAARKLVDALSSAEPGAAGWLRGSLDAAGGRRAAALAAWQQAQPAMAGSFWAADLALDLANALRENGQLEASAASTEAGLRADPWHGPLRNNLGSLLRDQGRAAAALPHFEVAVEAAPDLAPAWFNLGSLRLDMGQAAQAAAAFERSLALAPAQADAWYWLGHARMATGDSEGARTAYRESLRVDAQFLRARWALAMAQLEPVPADTGAERASREAFARELEALAAWVRTRAPARAWEAVAVTQPFYLAYKDWAGEPADALCKQLQAYGRLCAQAMAPWARKAGLARPSAPKAPALAGQARLRLGIASAHLHDHSVWNALVRGWVEQLDRERVELHLFALSARSDAETAFARRHADHFHESLGGWAGAAEAIAASKPDLLLYPEVGMDSTTGKLAALRLAPVQAATWGHPVTTGLPTVDHYLSAAAFEPADAQLQYSERLHLLPRLGCRPRRYGTKAAAPDLERMGLNVRQPLLLCAGTPFKYLPRVDALWVEIARQAAPCTLVFFRAAPEALSARLGARLRGAFQAAGLDFDAQVRFLPWQSQAGFFGWLQAATAVLDNPGFSGFNTVMQAVECATPLVALRGRTLRGNFGAGVLDVLGLAAEVADDEAGYVERAVRLGRDTGHRRQVSQQMAARRDALFADREAAHLGALLARLLN